MRQEMTQPITEDLHNLLGEDGYSAYSAYEHLSYYRSAWVLPLEAVFSAANMPVDDLQSFLLTQIVAANDHPVKISPTDLRSESSINWDSVTAQAADFLTPAQLQVLQTQALQLKTRQDQNVARPPRQSTGPQKIPDGTSTLCARFPPVGWKDSCSQCFGGWLACSCTAQAQDFEAVVSTVRNGYVRTRLADGSFLPESYILKEGDYWGRFFGRRDDRQLVIRHCRQNNRERTCEAAVCSIRRAQEHQTF